MATVEHSGLAASSLETIRRLTPIAWRGYGWAPLTLFVRTQDDHYQAVDPRLALEEGLFELPTTTPRMRDWSRRFAEAARDGAPLLPTPLAADDDGGGLDWIEWGRRSLKPGREASA